MNYYDYDYGYVNEVEEAAGVFGGILAGAAIYMLLMLALGIFMLVCNWKIFTKAGKEGWKSLIPIYNLVVLLEIAGLPAWYLVLFLVPVANIYAIFKLYIELAHKFGKSTGFGVATVFFSIICLPILAFGSCTYSGGSVNAGFEQPMQPQPMNSNNGVSYGNTVQQPMNVNNGVTYGDPVQPQTIGGVTYEQPVAAPMTQQPVQPTSVQPQQVEVSKKFCPNCGTQVDGNVTTCPSCRNNI